MHNTYNIDFFRVSYLFFKKMDCDSIIVETIARLQLLEKVDFNLKKLLMQMVTQQQSI